MEMVATSKSIARDYATGHILLTFGAEEFLEGGPDLPSGPLRVTVKPYKKKRSLDANAYYWTLITKLAGAMGISNNRCHQLMLRAYGTPRVVSGCLVQIPLPDEEEVEETVLESSRWYVKPTDRVKDGMRTYIEMRGSSDYDTAEMSRLIEGTIQECKDIGIEVLSPEELERMMGEYGQHHTH